MHVLLQVRDQIHFVHIRTQCCIALFSEGRIPDVIEDSLGSGWTTGVGEGGKGLARGKGPYWGDYTW